MCTTIIAYQPQKEWSVIIGANRDETLDRQWESPGRHWLDRPQIIGGLDLQSLGTWLAVNDNGLVAGVLNRPGTLGGLPGKKSRGQLVLDALKAAHADDAAAAVASINAAQFPGFQFFVADASRAYWLESNGTCVSLQLIPEGVNMITSLGMNNLDCSRTKRHLEACRQAQLPNPELHHQWNSWIEILSRPAKHEQRDGMTIVAPNYGTVCSALIGLHKSDLQKNIFLFCPGRPEKIKYKLVLPENRE
jgi:uncharacterized protein with NRDE domain